MPITTALVVAGIIVAFVIFGAVLAWADSQTRNLPRSATKLDQNANDNVTRLQPRPQNREELHAA